MSEKSKKIRIRPEKEGTEVVLYDLEAEIMDVIWTLPDEEISIGEVQERLEETRELAYTTVATTVNRLHDKGLLARRKEGRRHYYWPVMDREEFHRKMAVEVMKSFPESGREAMVAMLVDALSDDDPDALERLEALIKAKRDDE